MTARAIPVDDRVVIDDKRCHIPYVVEDTCEKCGTLKAINLAGSHHLMFPSLSSVNPDPRSTPVYFMCEKCDHEWQVRVVIRVSLEVVP